MSKTESGAKGEKSGKLRMVQDDAFKREAVRMLATSDRTSRKWPTTWAWDGRA